VIELDGVTLGGPLGVDTSPGAQIRILASRVPELSASTAGDLDISAGARLGSIEMKGSGHMSLSGSVASDVKMTESGNLTLSDGATVGGVDLYGAGSLIISKDVVVSSVKSSSSGSINISDNVAVESTVEVEGVDGTISLLASTVGGPMSIVAGVGDVTIDASMVSTGGLSVEKITGSIGLRASSLPGFAVKGLSGNVSFTDMQARNLRLEGVDGEVMFSGVKTSGSSVFSRIEGGIVCPSVTPAAGPSAASLVALPASSWHSWMRKWWRLA